jgi:DNA-binding NarL/FixJ family response regulator
MVTVVVVENLELMRDSVVHALSAADDMTVVGYCADGEAAVEVVLRERPDVVVMGLGLPGMDGAETARHIIEAWPAARILLHASDPTSDRARAAIRGGVVAVAPENMSVETLVQTIRVIADD